MAVIALDKVTIGLTTQTAGPSLLLLASLAALVEGITGSTLTILCNVMLIATVGADIYC